MSWGFQSRQVGTEWNPATRDLPRGAWPVCGEADHGLVAGIGGACTVLFDDPIFGLFAYGGEISPDAGAGDVRVIPRDGVRQRFHAVIGRRRLHLSLDRDGFAAEKAINVARKLDGFSFTLESRAQQKHQAMLIIEGLPPGNYSIISGESQGSFRSEAGRPVSLSITVEAGWTVTVQPEGVKKSPGN